jgi:hypothetical protein
MLGAPIRELCKPWREASIVAGFVRRDLWSIQTGTAMQRIVLLPALLLCGSLAAQSTCDSIQVENVRYDPFGNGLQVTLFNGSSQFLSGPTVDVLDADGITLGNGAMEFFGIVPGSTNVHQVHFTPQPPSPFTGTIRLNYSDWNGTASCAWIVTDMQLCPADTCLPLGVYAYQQGGSPEATDIDWSVTDADNLNVASGVLHIDSVGFGYAAEALCLPAGGYTLHMSQAVPAGNLIQVGMTQDDFAWTNGTNTQLPPGGSVDHPFSFFGPCADGVEGIATQNPEAPTLILDGRTLRIAASNGNTLGTLIVLDATGRMVRTLATGASSISIDLSGFAVGGYIVRPIGADTRWKAQRFILR